MVRPKPTVGDTSWFVRDRFGLFIHWGLYALPARHEWVKHVEQIPDEQYDVYFRHFDPDLYDPRLWAEAAAGAGMKYFVVTTKHHDGFCLWDSQLTDYKAPNTPCGKDLIRPMVEAFRERGLRVGFYHSVIDWHHPDFVVDNLHSMRGRPDREALNATRDQTRYAAYLHGQVRELLTGYGKIDVLFYDFSYPPEKGRNDWNSLELLKMTRELQPGIIVNDRLDLQDVEGGWDIRTPEQFMPREWVQVDGQPVVWETCQTFSGSWGYHRDEASWKSVEQLVQMLIGVVSRGGNLLLNVGPTGRGEFDDRALERLRGMGEWMKRHSRSIYGCTQAPDGIPCPQDCRLTYNPETNRLYVHIFAWPFVQLHIDGLAGKVAYAQLLNDASEVKMGEVPEHQASMAGPSPDTLTLHLPVRKPDVVVPVVELFLK
ncbi:MAG TPA: alpha-L-fucosidase [Armatimonadota bacterium]|nr:alpha-L-fucosidase [Armatimonadota bacterium]HQK93409.1 alpha-L-fucosidase [Armatimonadota bacterium]